MITDRLGRRIRRIAYLLEFDLFLTPDRRARLEEEFSKLLKKRDLARETLKKNVPLKRKG